MGPTSTSRKVPYSLSTPQVPSGRVPPPSVLVRSCIVKSPPSRSASAGTADIIPIALADVSRHRGGERLSFVGDPGGHRSSAVAARGGNEAVHRAARIEEAVAGFEQSVGLSLCLEYQATLEHIAGLVPRVRVIADARARRQHGRPDHDFLARHARLIVAFKNRAYRLRRGLRLLGGGAQGQYECGDQRNLCVSHSRSS